MKLSKKILAAAVVGVVACTSVLLVACAPAKNSKTIAIVAKGSTHAFWQSMEAGVKAQAKELGYTVSFVGPENETPDSVPVQKNQLAAAMATNPAGIGLATIGTGYNDYLEDLFDSKTPVVQFDSGIYAEDMKAVEDSWKNPVKSKVATSNIAASALAAQKVIEMNGAEIKASTGKYKIGVLQHDATQTGKDRVAGFQEYFNNSEYKDLVEITVTLGEDDKYATTLEGFAADTDLIYMTNEGVVSEVFDAVTAPSTGAAYNNMDFFGFDSGTAQLTWMEDKENKFGAELIGAITQNPYQMGVDTINQLHFAITQEYAKVTDIALAGAFWDKDNMVQLEKDGLLYKG